jgi:hypothetical protein
MFIDSREFEIDVSGGGGHKGGFPLGEIFRSNRNFYCSKTAGKFVAHAPDFH